MLTGILLAWLQLRTRFACSNADFLLFALSLHTHTSLCYVLKTHTVHIALQPSKRLQTQTDFLSTTINGSNVFPDALLSQEMDCGLSQRSLIGCTAPFLRSAWILFHIPEFLSFASIDLQGTLFQETQKN